MIVNDHIDFIDSVKEYFDTKIVLSKVEISLYQETIEYKYHPVEQKHDGLYLNHRSCCSMIKDIKGIQEIYHRYINYHSNKEQLIDFCHNLIPVDDKSKWKFDEITIYPYGGKICFVHKENINNEEKMVNAIYMYILHDFNKK